MVWDYYFSIVAITNYYKVSVLKASQVVLVVKNLPANAGDMRDIGLIPGLERPPGGGHGNLLQYSCLGNSRDRGFWQGLIESWTWLSD